MTLSSILAPIYLLIVVNVIEGSEFCYNEWKDESYFCTYGCCNDGADRGCCYIAGIIVGAVIGGLIFIAVVIALVCCCIKSKGHSGVVVGPGTRAGVAVVQHSTVFGQTQGQPTGMYHAQPGTVYPFMQPGTVYPPQQSGTVYPPQQPGTVYPPPPMYHAEPEYQVPPLVHEPMPYK